jgi:hypothetical protein
MGADRDLRRRTSLKPVVVVFYSVTMGADRDLRRRTSLKPVVVVF